MKTLRVINQTRGTVVAQEVSHLAGFWSRFLGLMGSKSLPDGRGVLIDPCYSIHTMFMRFPIDVVFLGEGDRVLKVAEAVRPFRAAIARGAKRVLELRAGAAAAAQVQEGDVLAISEV